jgi:hypothetical protein
LSLLVVQFVFIERFTAEIAAIIPETFSGFQGVTHTVWTEIPPWLVGLWPGCMSFPGLSID